MKNGFTLLLLFSSTLLFGQYFINEDTRWNLFIKSYGFNVSMSNITFEFRFDDEVIINNLSYKNLYYRQQNNVPEWTVATPVLYYREEAGVVYRRNPSNNTEEVIYDFNVDQIGQIVQLTDINYEVLAIDSIQLANGEMRRRIKMATYNHWAQEETYWIDGLGSLEDTMLPSEIAQEAVDGPDIILQCAYEQNEQIFMAPEFEECYNFSVDTKEIYTGNAIKVSPNPTSSRLLITNEENSLNVIGYTLRQMDGRILQQKLNSSTQWFEIDLTTNSNGIYILELYLSNQLRAIHRIVKM